MPTVKNIDELQYFTNRFTTIDSGFDYHVNYHPSAKSEYKSLPTFMAEFFDCKVHSCPLLVTNENHLITHFLDNIIEGKAVALLSDITMENYLKQKIP